jgi:hypothetical protein
MHPAVQFESPSRKQLISRDVFDFCPVRIPDATPTIQTGVFRDFPQSSSSSANAVTVT